MNKKTAVPPLEDYTTGNISLQVRTGIMNEWDKRIADEIQEHYTYPGLDYAAQRTILDVGCNIGAFSLFALSQNPNAVVVGVEVDDENAAIAKINLKGKAAVYHARLGYETGDFVLETLPYTSGSHRVVRRGEHKVIAPEGWETTTIEITAKTITLEQVMKRRKWERINLLKLDCEGAEYDIITGATIEALAACDHIIGEYHDGIARWEAECMPILAPHFEVMHLAHAPDWGRFWLRRWGKT